MEVACLSGRARGCGARFYKQVAPRLVVGSIDGFLLCVCMSHATGAAPQSLGAIENQSDPAVVAEDPEGEPAAAGLDLCRYQDERVDEVAEIHRQELRAAGAPRRGAGPATP